MKVLFIHNSVAEYRLEFWRLLSGGGRVYLQLLVTDKDLEKKAYNLKKDLSGLNIAYLSDDNFAEWLEKVREYDVMVLPPVDTRAAYKLSLPFIKAARSGNTKVVMWTEAWIWNKQPLHKIPKRWYEKHIRKQICDLSDVCIVAGTCSYNYMRGLGIAEDKLIKVFDSSTSPKSTLQDIRKIHGLPENSRIVLYLSRMMRRKGLDLLINAFDTIADRYPNTYLVLAGDGGFKAYCEQLAETKKSRDRIKFIGKVQPDVRATYFRESDMFVLPSYHDHGEIEIWGLVVNESLEQGCPVVATTAVGASFDLLDDNCGKIVKENDEVDLVKGIEYVLNKPQEELRANCKKKYSEYSVQKMADGFYNVFEHLLE